MSIETSSTKLYLRELAPLEALDKIESFRIPSPYKEILIACCVDVVRWLVLASKLKP